MKDAGRALFPYLALVSFLISSIPVNGQVTGLSFRPVDAAYSTALDRIVLISANPNQLHIYNPVTQSDQTIALSAAPQNVCLSSDGTHGAVAFTNAVAYVDLQAVAISNTFSNVAVGTGRVICGSGYIYVFPSYEGSIISIDIGTGQTSTASSFTYASGGVFDSAVNAVYSTENGLSPNSLNRYDTSGGVAGNSTAQPSGYFSVFNVCGPLWLSHDGSIIYSACGPVYRASTNPAEDMRYLGVLPGVNNSQSLATSDSLSQIAVIPTAQPYTQPPALNADAVVNLYSSSSFNSVGQFATTPFHVNSASFPAHGRWVFYNSSSSAMFIITQADSSAGLALDYAIENVNLTDSNSCNATFDAPSASAMAAGSYATAQILAGEDCAFTAVSNVPWITLSSGYYGSGNTTLTYLVRPNLSGSLRSGTINLGSETFTVDQDAAGPASPSTPLSFKPVTAAYDKALDKIVMVSASPNELHIYDPVSQADQIVPLTYIPLSLSVRPDGQFAAVGHSGHITIVNLQAQTVSQTISVDMDAAGMALASNGYAYAFPRQTNTFADINSVQISNGALTTLSDTYYGNIPRIDPSGNYLYVGAAGEGASELNISNGPATLVGSFFGAVGGNIWLSEDGVRLIDSGGNVYFTSTNPSGGQGLPADGRLFTAGVVDWVADSQAHQQIAILSDPSYGPADTQLQIYASNGLQLESQTAMPGFSNNDTTYVSRGKYLFWNSAASKLFAVTEADITSGLLSDYAVNTIAMPESLPGCSYAVSPSSINAPPASSSWFFNVTTSCSWSATSAGVSWLDVGSASNLGNGQFTVSVQNNAGGARSASIAVGNQTVTVNQAPSSCTYTLSPTSASFSESGGTGTVNLTTGAGCPWTVQSSFPWLTPTGSQSGTGAASIQFSVASAAGSPASRSGILYIAGIAFNVNATATSGTGLSVLPSSLNFGNIQVLTPGAPQTLTLSNPTSQTIATGNISVSGASAGSFSFWNDCGASIAPGASCFLNVTFTPLLMGNQSARLNIPGDANGTPVTISFSGSGQLTGAFEIVSMPTGKVLEMPGALASNGALVAQNALNGFEQQEWQFVPTGDGYYIIKNLLTGKVLDVVGGGRTDGTLVQQWDYLGAANQQWQLSPVDDVHYSIINRNSGLALDVTGGSTVDGAQIQQWTYLGDEQQLWVLEPVSSYNITNNLSSYALDVTGGSTSNGALLQQYSSSGYRQQQWQFVPVGGGYYAIMSRNSGKVLDVIGGSIDQGILVQQWDYLQATNQQWQIVPLDGTNYEIVNRRSGYVLDDLGYSTSAGTPIQQWAYFGGRNQQWQITPVTFYNIANQNSGLVLDVVNGSSEDGANVQQWSSNGFQQQQWQLVQSGNGTYAIVNNLSSKVLDVTSSSTTDGAQVGQNTFSAAAGQQWQLIPTPGGGSYEIKNVNSGKVLDMTGFSVSDGGLLQQWDDLATANQQWQLIPLTF